MPRETPFPTCAHTYMGDQSAAVLLGVPMKLSVPLSLTVVAGRSLIEVSFDSWSGSSLTRSHKAQMHRALDRAIAAVEATSAPIPAPGEVIRNHGR